LGMSIGESDRHGGPEHRYWCRLVAERLRATGYEVEEEAAIGGGRTIDLLATRDGKRTAFEIETGKSDAATNVKKCLAAGIYEIVVVAASRRAKRLLTSAVPQHPRVTIVTGQEAVSALGEDRATTGRAFWSSAERIAGACP